MSVPAHGSEVKGVWFLSAFDYLRRTHGEAAVERLLAAAAPEYRDVYRAPIASAWYGEELLEHVLELFFRQVAQGDTTLFEQAMEGCTERGIHRVFQIMLRMTSPAFVIRRVPTMWRQIRRGPGQVEVVQDDGGSELRYTRFPWFANPLYRLMTVGSLRAVVQCCTGQAARVGGIEATASSYTVRIAYAVAREPASNMGSLSPVASLTPSKEPTGRPGGSAPSFLPLPSRRTPEPTD